MTHGHGIVQKVIPSDSANVLHIRPAKEISYPGQEIIFEGYVVIQKADQVSRGGL